MFLVCSCSYAFDISLNRSLPISNVNPLCLFHLSGCNSLGRRQYARVISLAVALRWSPRVRKAVVVPELVVWHRRGVSGGGRVFLKRGQKFLFKRTKVVMVVRVRCRQIGSLLVSVLPKSVYPLEMILREQYPCVEISVICYVFRQDFFQEFKCC